MPSVSSWLTSFLSGSSQVSAALANVTFDFSLVKLEAPVEFSAIGSSLSPIRRVEGEEGAIHRTARRLAALFEHQIPSTPKLISAYGCRVTDIIAKPGVNPTGTKQHGPFEPFVGADGTAMWAAATSGVGALGIYLLACLLAQAWDAKNAVSIWVELVQTRRRRTREGFESNAHITESSLLASFQDITRDDLQTWDSSARSWLRSADQAYLWHVKQLELVTKDTVLQFGGGPSTYDKVISAWQVAMNGVEELLNGRPQQISNAVLLLAFRSWHLFPDLLVLRGSPTKIPFRDSLFPSNAVGTIGLDTTDSDAPGGVRWSLSLSHLRYYGGPIDVESEPDSSKISPRQLRLVALACLFGKWNLSSTQFLTAARWIIELWDIVTVAAVELEECDTTTRLEWLYYFARASEDLVKSHKTSTIKYDDDVRLICFARRRGVHFLDSQRSWEPFFGLINAHTLAGLRESTDIDCGISFLRSIAQASSFRSEEVVIICAHWLNTATVREKPVAYEYATAVASEKPYGRSKKRNSEGQLLISTNHSHWLYPGGHWSREQTKSFLKTRLDFIEERCEEAVVVESRPDAYDHEQEHSLWTNPPAQYPTKNHISYASRRQVQNPGDTEPNSTQHIVVEPSIDTKNKVDLSIALGDSTCGLYMVNTTLRHLEYDITLDPLEALQLLRQQANKRLLWTYLQSLLDGESPSQELEKTHVTYARTSERIGISLVVRKSKVTYRASKAVLALCAAAKVLEPIQTPIISLKVLSSPLCDALWAAELVNPYQPPESAQKSYFPNTLVTAAEENTSFRPLTRAEAFACVAYFDSGSVNLDPSHLKKVLAMCFENSIYVAGVILSDPAEPTADYDIRRITGNIGRQGICLLIAPLEPRVREPGFDYKVVTHAPYDGKREDSFTHTTLHLSFTNWVQPMDTGGERTIDQQVFFIESVISVFDRGNHVADLDILGIDFSQLGKLWHIGGGSPARCKAHQTGEHASRDAYISIDSWEELIDYPPTKVGLFRARGNWAARLAAVSVIFQLGQGHAVGLFNGEDLCLACLEKQLAQETANSEYKSFLPAFCID